MTYRTRFQYLFDRAADIAHASNRLNPLPPLFFFTDPRRTPHPEDIAAHLPRGTGVIYRHFGERHAAQRARLLARIAGDNGLALLIGNDVEMALEVGAHGVHLPERALDGAQALRRDHPGLRLTAACHGIDAMAKSAEQSLDAVFVSPVFVSHSASAAGVVPLGVAGARDIALTSPVPVYGLGGINCDTVTRLHDSGLAGVAAVDAFTLKD